MGLFSVAPTDCYMTESDSFEDKLKLDCVFEIDGLFRFSQFFGMSQWQFRHIRVIAELLSERV